MEIPEPLCPITLVKAHGPQGAVSPIGSQGGPGSQSIINISGVNGIYETQRKQSFDFSRWRFAWSI